MVESLKLVGILALIVFLLRLRWNLGLVLVVASAVTGLLFAPAPVDWVALGQSLALDALTAAIDPLTLRLVAIVLLITFLGEILRSTLQLEGLIHSLSDLIVDRRWLLALLPMLIGLLPMVGGAIFSAPMVEEAGRELNLNRERQTFINYWFRHTLESVFPLYPSLILAAGLLNVPVRRMAATQWPLFLAALAGGILFGLVGVRSVPSPGDGRPDRRETLTLLFKSIWPIVLVLVLALVLGLDLILSLLLTIAALIGVHRLGPRRVWESGRHMPLGVAPVIIGAMIFRQVLDSSGAVRAASAALGGLGLPLPLVVFSASFIPGLLTGLLTAAFAIGFPIGLPLCGSDPVGGGWGLLAYAGGLAGILLSPMHLCLALTRVYFKAEWGGIYRRLMPAALLLAVTAAMVFLVR